MKLLGIIFATTALLGATTALESNVYDFCRCLNNCTSDVVGCFECCFIVYRAGFCETIWIYRYSVDKRYVDACEKNPTIFEDPRPSKLTLNLSCL